MLRQVASLKEAKQQKPEEIKVGSAIPRFLAPFSHSVRLSSASPVSVYRWVHLALWCSVPFVGVSKQIAEAASKASTAEYEAVKEQLQKQWSVVCLFALPSYVICSSLELVLWLIWL